MVNDISRFSYIEEALNRVFPDNEEARAEYEALLKAANAHKHFWRPIEQCLKEPGKEYELIARHAGGIDPIDYRFWGCRFDAERNCWIGDRGIPLSDENYIVTHFAEIPPLPKEA